VDVYITKPFTIDGLRRQLARPIGQIAAQQSEARQPKQGGLFSRLLGEIRS
jgi:hypothetical protein